MIGELSLASVRITCCHDTTRFPEYLDDVWTFTYHRFFQVSSYQEKASPKINVQIDVYPPWNEQFASANWWLEALFPLGMA